MPAEEIKVVVVAMFEPVPGRQGELTRFREGLRLRPWNLPGAQSGEAWRNDDGVAALVAGVGPVKTATSLLTFALLAGVDFRRTYWLISGIAGGNPSTCSLGSPLWAEWVVDGDAAYDFHPADHPPEWETGILPLGALQPYGPMACDPALFGNHDQVFHLDGPLAAWAYDLTRNLPLLDPPGLAAARAPYAHFGLGGLPPAVGHGDVLSAARFWHGAGHHAWAEKWIPHWTSGRGRFATASMEDIGTLGALAQLGRLGRADPRRILLLRSVSNYTLPPPGRPAHLNLAGDADHDPEAIFSGLEASLENGWRAGHAVIRALLEDWPRWRENLPGEQPSSPTA
jgi:purine nucleoside permease